MPSRATCLLSPSTILLNKDELVLHFLLYLQQCCRQSLSPTGWWFGAALLEWKYIFKFWCIHNSLEWPQYLKAKEKKKPSEWAIWIGSNSDPFNYIKTYSLLMHVGVKTVNKTLQRQYKLGRAVISTGNCSVRVCTREEISYFIFPLCYLATFYSLVSYVTTAGCIRFAVWSSTPHDNMKNILSFSCSSHIFLWF